MMVYKISHEYDTQRRTVIIKVKIDYINIFPSLVEISTIYVLR